MNANRYAIRHISVASAAKFGLVLGAVTGSEDIRKVCPQKAVDLYGSANPQLATGSRKEGRIRLYTNGNNYHARFKISGSSPDHGCCRGAAAAGVPALHPRRRGRGGVA